MEGSRCQQGDEELAIVPLRYIAGRQVVVEEKLDGANSGISFNERGELLLQSRGHYLTGGPRERQFALFKQWAITHAHCLHERLGSRYIVYGEWLYAKHTIFYDALPHYFLEFDVLNLETGQFLSTSRRVELLRGLPIVSAPVLFEGKLRANGNLTSLLTHSAYISDAAPPRLKAQAQRLGLDPERVVLETDLTGTAEGLYIKLEREGVVTDRFKYVRETFSSTVDAAEGHWMNRPLVPNLLRDSVDLFAR